MKILFLAPYPLGEAPSQRFRFEHFLESLEQFHKKRDFQTFISEEEWKILYQPGKKAEKLKAVLTGYLRRMSALLRASQYDYIFIHREVTPFGPPVFEWLLAKAFKKKIIYDFDDAIWLPDQNRENPLWRFLKWRSKVASICKWSWKVSVGNEYLADFARKYCDQVTVFPTVVDTGIHTPRQRPKASSQKPVLGWTGSHSTLFYLDEIIPALQELETNYEFEFLVIANENPELPLKNFRFIKWNKETEIEDLAQIDIGVMPLLDNEWSKGKCGFKLIQYLALGIPAVASPVGVNTDLVKENETGFLASSHKEWIEKLRILLSNETLRTQLGENGRKLIVECYSVESQKEKFSGLFNPAP